MRIKQTASLPLGIVLVTIAGLLMLSVIFMSGVVQAKGADQHLITIHDGATSRSVISSKDTLREIFAEADIAIDEHDIIEPGLDKELVGTDYQVNVYRARPITVVDGTYQVRVMTASQTPAQIAKAADIELRDEDTTSMALSSDIIADGASLEMNIDRATPVKLDLYGRKETVYTQASTVGEFLKEKSITIDTNDRVSKVQTSSIQENMVLQIWREGKQTITRDETIQPPVNTIQDANRPVGYKAVDTKGKAGKKTVTYEVLIRNGKEVKRKQIQSVVIEKPQPKVVTIGTKISLPAGSHEDWMRQAGISSSDFGYVNAIFSQESGWNPSARNPAGYVGLGQTSEANLSGACSNWQSDPICQIKFFNGYATSRYGSWQDAYYFKFGEPGGKGGHGWW